MVNVVVGFGISIITTRMLGVVGRGDYALFSNSLGLAAVWLGFSLPVAVIYYVSSNRIKPNKVFFSFSAFILLTGMLVFLLLQLLRLFGWQHLVFPPAHDSILWVVQFCVIFLSTSFNSFLYGFLNARQKFVHLSVISSLFTLTTLFLYAVFYFRMIEVRMDAFSLIVLTTLVLGVLQMAVNLVFYTKFIPDAWRVEWLRISEIRQMLLFSFIGWLGNAIQFLSYRLDLWFVDYYHGKVETGIYSLAVTLAQMLWIFPNVIANVLMSYLSKPEAVDRGQLTYKFVRISFWTSLASGIAFIVFCYLFVPVLYGEDFDRAPGVVLLLMLGIIPFSIAPIIASYHISVHRIQLNLFGAIAGFVAALLLYAILIPPYGIVGACIGTIVSYNLNNFLLMHWFQRESRMPVWNIGISFRDFKLIAKGLNIRR